MAVQPSCNSVCRCISLVFLLLAILLLMLGKGAYLPKVSDRVVLIEGDFSITGWHNPPVNVNLGGQYFVFFASLLLVAILFLQIFKGLLFKSMDKVFGILLPVIGTILIIICFIVEMCYAYLFLKEYPIPGTIWNSEIYNFSWFFSAICYFPVAVGFIIDLCCTVACHQQQNFVHEHQMNPYVP